MATPKLGQPKIGIRNARRLTRRESEITGLTRTVLVESTKTGNIVFTKFNKPLARGTKTATNKLVKFWTTV